MVLVNSTFEVSNLPHYFLVEKIRNGLGLDTGIDLDKLIDVGEFICGIIGRPTQSKVGRAMLSKRAE